MAEEEQPTEDKQRQELEAINTIFQVLNALDMGGRKRVFQTVATYYQFGSANSPRAISGPTPNIPIGPFSEDRSMSPKTFMMQKQPMTDVERVACCR